MKLCFTNEKAVETWFDRVTKCGPDDPSLNVYSSGKRVMAQGHTLYSYGTHFPMAIWYPDEQVFLLNTGIRRSASTGKHQGYVRRNAPEHSIEVGNLIGYDPRKVPDRFMARCDVKIRAALESHKRAWKHKAPHVDRAEQNIRERNLFVRAFKVNARELPEDITAALVTLKLAA